MKCKFSLQSALRVSCLVKGERRILGKKGSTNSMSNIASSKPEIHVCQKLLLAVKNHTDSIQET